MATWSFLIFSIYLFPFEILRFAEYSFASNKKAKSACLVKSYILEMQLSVLFTFFNIKKLIRQKESEL